MPGIFYDPRVYSDWADQLGNRAVQLAQIYAKRKQLERQERLEGAKTRMSLGLKKMVLLKGNPEAQKEAWEKDVKPGARTFSELGAWDYSVDDVDNFTFDPTNKAAQKLAASANKIQENMNAGKISPYEAKSLLDSALGGYQGELSKTQLSAIEDITENIETKMEEQKRLAPFTPVPIFKEAPGLAEQRANLGLTGEAPQELTMGKSPAEQYLGERASLAESLVRAGMPLDKALEVAKEKEPKTTAEIEMFKRDPEAYRRFKEAGRKPVKKKTSWQRKTRTYLHDGKLYKQDYDFNPVTREEKLVGKPYQAKDVGSALMQWLNNNDPKGIF